LNREGLPWPSEENTDMTSLILAGNRIGVRSLVVLFAAAAKMSLSSALALLISR